jgi:hypothetical protein
MRIDGETDEDFELQPRSKEEIGEEEEKLCTKVWYNRCYCGIIQGVEAGIEERPPQDIWDGMMKAACEAREKYPDVQLSDPFDERELGRLEGQLYALRWCLGWEGDGLMDT